jgi:hypothetical protein
MNIKITRRKFIKSASVALPIIVGPETADTSLYGKLVSAMIQSIIGANCRVRYGDKVVDLHFKPMWP